MDRRYQNKLNFLRTFQGLEKDCGFHGKNAPNSAKKFLENSKKLMHLKLSASVPHRLESCYQYLCVLCVSIASNFGQPAEAIAQEFNVPEIPAEESVKFVTLSLNPSPKVGRGTLRLLPFSQNWEEKVKNDDQLSTLRLLPFSQNWEKGVGDEGQLPTVTDSLRAENPAIAIEHLPEVEIDSLPLNETPNSGEVETEGDPELGILRLEEIAKPAISTQPSAYLLGWAGYLRSNNIFSGVDPVDDGLFRAGLTFLSVREISSTTSVFGSLGGNLIRYQNQSQFDYNQLNFNAGLSQNLFDRTYAEVGWINQCLFAREGGDRFLNDHSLYLQLRRQDAIAERLTLDTSYLLRFSFADPEIRSQTLNAFSASFSYFPYTSLQLALDYQFVLANFSNIDRRDRYHQLLARLSYTLSPHSRLELFGGRSFGSSSDPNIDFDNWIFGIGLGFTLF